MKFKGTIILLVIFILLGGYVLFFNKKEVKKGNSKIFDIKKSDIVEIDIYRGKRSVVLKKVNKRWEIEKPLSTSADFDKLQQMVRTLKRMLYERIVEKNCRNFKKYGLDSGFVKVVFKDKKGNKFSFEIGDKNPSGDYRYVRKDGENKVYLVYGFDLEKFKPDVESLRDKSLAYVNLTDMLNFTLKRGDGDFFFKKEHYNWYMEKPFYARMDDSNIRDMLKKVEFEKVLKNIDLKSSDDYSKYFSSPYISLEMNYENGDRSVLEISKKNPVKDKHFKDSYFGRNVETNRYFLVKKDVVDKLLTPIDKLRSKDLAEFYPFEVSGITLKDGGKSIFLKKKDDSTWILKSNGVKKEVKNDKVIDYLGKIRDMKVEGFLDPPLNLKDYGIETSRRALILDLKKGSESSGLKLTFGEKDKKGKLIYVKNSNFPYVMELKVEKLKEIFVAPDFFEKGEKK